MAGPLVFGSVRWGLIASFLGGGGHGQGPNIYKHICTPFLHIVPQAHVKVNPALDEVIEAWYVRYASEIKGIPTCEVNGNG